MTTVIEVMAANWVIPDFRNYYNIDFNETCRNSSRFNDTQLSKFLHFSAGIVCHLKSNPEDTERALELFCQVDYDSALLKVIFNDIKNLNPTQFNMAQAKNTLVSAFIEQVDPELIVPVSLPHSLSPGKALAF
jgi:hypothetical protein